MTMIKSHTDLEQSKKLTEILSTESADGWWREVSYGFYKLEADIPRGWYGVPSKGMPSWSLASLLDIIPQEIFDGEYVINITEGCDNKWILTYDNYYNRNHSYYGLSSTADNLVDAAVELIIKLHDRKLL